MNFVLMNVAEIETSICTYSPMLTKNITFFQSSEFESLKTETITYNKTFKSCMLELCFKCK